MNIRTMRPSLPICKLAGERQARNFFIALFALFFWIVPPQPARAQAPSTPQLTLAQTIKMALAASSQLAIANKNLDRDQALIDQAEAGYRPQLGANGSWTHLNQPVKIHFGNGPAILVQPEDTQALNAALT